MTKSIVVTALALTLGVSLGYAQGGRGSVQFTVPFQFVAGGKNLPAGSYTVERDATKPTLLKIQGKGSNSAVLLVPVVTRLAPQGKHDVASFVFDKVGNRSYLSEVWIPGEDGFLVKATVEKHAHQAVHEAE